MKGDSNLLQLPDQAAHATTISVHRWPKTSRALAAKICYYEILRRANTTWRVRQLVAFRQHALQSMWRRRNMRLAGRALFLTSSAFFVLCIKLTSVR